QRRRDRLEPSQDDHAVRAQGQDPLERLDGQRQRPPVEPGFHPRDQPGVVDLTRIVGGAAVGASRLPAVGPVSQPGPLPARRVPPEYYCPSPWSGGAAHPAHAAVRGDDAEALAFARPSEALARLRPLSHSFTSAGQYFRWLPTM